MGKDTAQKQRRLIAAILLIAAQSADTDEAIWFSGPDSCGGICISSPPGAEPVPLNPHILESIEEDFISSFDLSPEGHSIVFIEMKEGPGWNFSDIWMMDSDGTNLREIYESGRGGWEASDSRGRYWTSSEINELSLGIEWSPDGQEILFYSHSWHSFRFINTEGTDLYRWEERWKDRNVSWGRYYQTDLQWTPSGDIVYQGYGLDTVFVRSRDGTIKMKIPIPGARYPKLSPDGSKLAFVIRGNTRTDPPDENSIFVLDLASKEHKFIANGDMSSTYQPGAYSWSPSGDKISYRGIDGLYVINADGTDSTFLFETGVVWDIDWISDSPTSTVVSPTSWGSLKREQVAE